MLRVVRLVVKSDGCWWTVSPLTGNLLRFDHVPKASPFDWCPAVVVQALSFVERPFACRSPWPGLHVNVNDAKVRHLRRMHCRLRLIGNRRFILSIAYATFVHPLFETTREAMAAVAALPEQHAERASMCLQRSLLVAKTSRSFQSGGVVFVGANVRTGDMHAWVIENGEQPDSDDRDWINYRPLLALLAA